MSVDRHLTHTCTLCPFWWLVRVFVRPATRGSTTTGSAGCAVCAVVTCHSCLVAFWEWEVDLQKPEQTYTGGLTWHLIRKQNVLGKWQFGKFHQLIYIEISNLYSIENYVLNDRAIDKNNAKFQLHLHNWHDYAYTSLDGSSALCLFVWRVPFSIWGVSWRPFVWSAADSSDIIDTCVTNPISK